MGRFVLDVGGPLTGSGALRGRVVGVTETTNSFVDIVGAEQTTLYGILEADVTPATTVRLGATWADGKSQGSRGLPTHATGELLDISRSTFAGADWNRSVTRGTEVFADVTRGFDNAAVLTARANSFDRKRDGRLAFANAPYDPETGLTWLLPEWRIDTTLEMPFVLGGFEQTVILGADYHRSDERLDRARNDELPLALFDPDYDLPEPAFELDRFDLTEYDEYGFYGQARSGPWPGGR